MPLSSAQMQALYQTLSSGNSSLFVGATPGMTEQERNQWINQYGGSMGGNGSYNPGLVQDTGISMANSSGTAGASMPEAVKKMYIEAGIMDPTGTRFLKKQDDAGNWVAVAEPVYAGSAGPSTGWSGTTADGGFAGGTGTGVTTPAVTVGANGTYAPVSQSAPVSQAASGQTVRNGRGNAGPAPTAPATAGSAATHGTSAPGGAPMTPSAPNPAPGTTGIPAANTAAPGTVDPVTRNADLTTPMDFFDDEGYQFRKKQGMEGIQSSAAAKGGLMSGATLKALEGFNSGLASDEYGKAYDRYDTNRKFGEGQFQSDRTYKFTSEKDARDFAENVRQNDQNFGENQRKFDVTFNQNTKQWELTFNRDTAQSDRDFNENTRRYDQGFNYTAATADRTFNQQNLKDLSDLALRATGGDNDAAAKLAGILGLNAATVGAAGAAGTAGGAQNWTNIINNIVKVMTGNNTVAAAGGKP
jgi:hypothetical protein